MNRIFPLFISLMLSLYAIAGINSKPYERPVILSGSTETHVSNECPTATFVTSGTLRVDINEAHYSSYSVRLTPSDGGCDIVVPATSATVSIPITNTSTDYVITVDGGDYGTYDGVFSPAGHTAVTLSDTQAIQLVKNRRDSNHDINVYTATVNSLVNDPHYCRIDSLPNYTWATDNSAKKLIL